MRQVATKFQKIMKLRTLCVGGVFWEPASAIASGNNFPKNVFSHSDDFEFCIASGFDKALEELMSDHDIDLVFLDADGGSLSAMTMFVTQVKEIRSWLPVVVFSSSVGSTMRHLMRARADWHFTKYSDELCKLAQFIHQYVFSPMRWEDVFAYYTRDDVKPRIEPGLSLTDLEALRQNPEEQYIIKRLFANSEIVQLFRMDEGFSGSRIYTVKPKHQLKRILKIDSVDDLEAVRDKQERLIQPRLFRQVGQIRGKIISAQHLGGACYSLAGSNQDAITLTQFLLDQNQVRKELLDRILVQLKESLSELYAGSAEIELRYWAPLYSGILPPCLTLLDAELVGEELSNSETILDANHLTTVSTVPGNQILEEINLAVRRGDEPTVILRGFEISEMDSKQGVLYLQDTLTEQYPVDPALVEKEHPILRFKILMRNEDQDLLAHPFLRRGKKVAIRGRVVDTLETILARSVEGVSGQSYDFDAESFVFSDAKFIPLLENVRHLLWEVGREDMIVPPPLVAPVVHGDLNAGNILVESTADMPIWLIDFSHARTGHIYFDLAKLEVEFRTHVFYRLFREMVAEHIWDEKTANKFILLIENLLLQNPEVSFEEFAANIRNCQAEWYDNLYTQFPLYFENLLYFLFSLRRIARLISPERFQRHYPVAVFFQSVTALKYPGLNRDPWHPWSKRLALACALVHGKEAVNQSKRPKDVTRLLSRLRQRSALGLLIVGQGDNRKYFMQWNNNWDRFNLVGGRVNNAEGDQDSYARALQRKLGEELGLKCRKDYLIKRELPPVVRKQFSRRQHIFKEYEFRLFEIKLLPRHPRTEEEFIRFAQRISPGNENLLLSRTEILHLRTIDGRPISETARIILQEIGEIESTRKGDQSTLLDLELSNARPLVNRGRVQVAGSLVNARFGNLIENVLVEVLPRPGYIVEHDSSAISISELDAGQEFPLEIWLRPREDEAKLTMRVTYYDTRGNEYRQILDAPIQFRSPIFSLFHLDNPYIISKPIRSGSDMLYVGRKEVFNWIGGNLIGKERPQSLILTGQPRIGKTSTLYQLMDGAQGKLLREFPDHPLIPIYLNIDGLDIENTGGFFSWLSKIIARNLRNRGIEVHEPVSWPANGQGYRLFDQYLDQVETSLPNDSLVVLILDELERLEGPIEKGALDHDILPYLHSLMQHRSRLSFIIAGTYHLRKDFWQLVFNAGENMELTTLSRRETERLIREPVQPTVRYDDLAVEHIWRATSGHPYLTQLICHRIMQFEYPRERRQGIITIDQVQRILEKILDEDDGYFLRCWQELSPAEKHMLLSLAELQGSGEEAVTFEAIVPKEDGDRGTRALKKLMYMGLVRRVSPSMSSFNNSNKQAKSEGVKFSEGAFTLAHGLLRRWMMRMYQNRSADKISTAA